MVESKPANYISSNLKPPCLHQLSLAPYADSSPSHKECLIPAKNKACEQAVIESRYRHYQIMWDKHSAIVFPALFIIFNILYWSYYFIWLSYWNKETNQAQACWENIFLMLEAEGISLNLVLSRISCLSMKKMILQESTRFSMNTQVNFCWCLYVAEDT